MDGALGKLTRKMKRKVPKTNITYAQNEIRQIQVMRSSTNTLHWLKCSACQCFKVSRLLQIRHHFCFLLPFSIGLKNACKTSRSGNFIRTTTFKDTYRTKNKKQQAEINKSRAMCRETHRAKTIMTMLMMIMKSCNFVIVFHTRTI